MVTKYTLKLFLNSLLKIMQLLSYIVRCWSRLILVACTVCSTQFYRLQTERALLLAENFHVNYYTPGTLVPNSTHSNHGDGYDEARVSIGKFYQV